MYWAENPPDYYEEEEAIRDREKMRKRTVRWCANNDVDFADAWDAVGQDNQDEEK